MRVGRIDRRGVRRLRSPSAWRLREDPVPMEPERERYGGRTHLAGSGRTRWTSVLRQMNASSVGRRDIPDGIMYLDDNAKTRAMSVSDARAIRDWHGAGGSQEVAATVGSADLRRSGTLYPDPPQIHRYLNRVEVRWGILTSGTQWRLYHKGGRSISDDFLEIDLPAALGVRQPAEDLSWRLPDRPRRRHAVHPFHTPHHRCIKTVHWSVASSGRQAALLPRVCARIAFCRCGFMHQTNLLGPEPWQARVTHHAW